MRILIRLLACFAALCAAALPAAAEKRVALVLGNAAYKEAPLKNPVNDARAMAAKLKQLGFTVILRENTTKLEMERAVADFGDQLGPETIGLFFYAGHGMQVDGRNFLVPTDARIATQARVRLETLDVDLVLDQMAAAGSRVNLVLLDACRNNPFERRFRATGGGLAQINAPQGTLISYATAPGKVAADGAGDNGLYTAELLRALDTPGLQVEEVFKRVRIEVARVSQGAQTPWEASSLTGTFYFRDPAATAAQAPLPAPPPVAAPPAAVSPDRDAVFWTSIQNSDNPALFEAYLQQFPAGTFAPIARARIDALRKPAPAALAAAPAPVPAPAPAPLPTPAPMSLPAPAAAPAPPAPPQRQDLLAAAIPPPAAAEPATPSRGIDLRASYAANPRKPYYVVTSKRCGMNYKLRASDPLVFKEGDVWDSRFSGDNMLGGTRIQLSSAGLWISLAADSGSGGVTRDQADRFRFTFSVSQADIRPDGSFTYTGAGNQHPGSRCGDYTIEFVLK